MLVVEEGKVITRLTYYRDLSRSCSTTGVVDALTGTCFLSISGTT